MLVSLELVPESVIMARRYLLPLFHPEIMESSDFANVQQTPSSWPTTTLVTTV